MDTPDDQNKSRKPWNDNEGRRLPLDELRVVSRTWTKATWNAYLRAIESPLIEELPDNFEAVLRDYEKRQAETYEPECEEKELGFQKLDAAIDELPPMEKAIIQGIFWDHLSLRDLAHAYGVSRTTITKRYEEALARLREQR